MNRLYIIGNGYDLAHKRKTSYGDFMFFLLKESLTGPDRSYSYNYDGLLWTCFKEANISLHKNINNFDNFYDLKSFAEKLGYSFTPKGKLIKSIFNDFLVQRWVDLESVYYALLKELANYKGTRRDDMITLINNEFDNIKSELTRYLSNIDPLSEVSKNILSIFDSDVKDDYTLPHLQDLKGKKIDYNLILDFNYTDTISHYIANLDSKRYEHIQIHGNIDNPEGLIFGYGDEVDETYKEIENLNNNNFFKHIKSFNYLKNSKYSKMARFVESGEMFEVYVFGHSLGLSDRTLLNFIFESENMLSVKFFYYQRPDGSTDFIDKSFEASRHFSNKAAMRLKIVPEDKCLALPQL